MDKDPVGDGRKRTMFHGRKFYEYDGVVYEWLHKDPDTHETVFLDVEKDEEIRLKGTQVMLITNQANKNWREDWNIEETENDFINHDTGVIRQKRKLGGGGK